MTKIEILEKHCPFKNVSGNREYFTKEILDAMQEYADQEVIKKENVDPGKHCPTCGNRVSHLDIKR